MGDITTWIGVAASSVSAVVTITTVYIRANTKRKIAAIDAKTPDAARIIADAVTSFGLDANKLTKEQTFVLARAEIAARDRRHARVLWTSLGLAGMLAVTTLILSRRGEDAGDTYNQSTHVNVNPGVITVTVPAGPVPSALPR
jgi:hypothetical protein